MIQTAVNWYTRCPEEGIASGPERAIMLTVSSSEGEAFLQSSPFTEVVPSHKRPQVRVILRLEL